MLRKVEIDSTDSDRWDIYGALNEAQRDLLNVLPIYLLPAKTASRPITANYYLYQYPADFVQRADGLIHAKLFGNEARIIPMDQPVNQLSLDQQPTFKYPIIWLHAERGYEILPHPIADDSDGQILTFIYQLPTISASQVSLFDQGLRSLLVYRAAMSAAANEAKKPEIAKLCVELYQHELAKFIKA